MSQCRLSVVLLGLLSLATPPAEATEKTSPPRTDRYGDPLPKGALLRLGSARLRVDEEAKAFAF